MSEITNKIRRFTWKELFLVVICNFIRILQDLSPDGSELETDNEVICGDMG